MKKAKYKFLIFANENEQGQAPLASVEARTLDAAKSAVIKASEQFTNKRLFATDGTRCIVWHKIFRQCLGYYRGNHRTF